MRLLAPILLLGGLLCGCSDPLTRFAPPETKNKKKGPAEAPPPPSNCHLVAPDFLIAKEFGMGGFHRENPSPGARFLFDCEWRVDHVEPGEARRQVTYQAACGGEARVVRRIHGKERPGDVKAAVRVGFGGVAFVGAGLGRESIVRLLFESAAMPGCWVRVHAPGSVDGAVRLSRAIEKFLDSRPAG